MDIIKDLGQIALGSRLKRLSDQLMYDVHKIYKQQHSDFEPRWFALTYLLYENGEMPVLDIAAALKISHPAIVQFVNQMNKKKLVVTEKDVKDKRKTIVRLSEEGRKIFESIKPVLPEIESAVKEIISETKYDVLHVIDKIEKSLAEQNLFERVNNRVKNKLMEKVEVIEYNSGHKDHFKSLNIEWLKKYFYVEPEDEKILSDPEKYIINPGGMIFFARINNEIVGTCAVIKIDDKTFELAKMAVTEKARGKQIGKKLALVVIGYAISKGAKYVELETAHKLTAAVNLYEKLGFVHVPFNSESKYQRSTFKMRLELPT